MPLPDDPVTILIVDDEEGILESCQRILRHEGYRVLIANTGREGLELARRHRPELVLSDVVLPDSTGMNMLRSIREIDGEAVVILITAFATVEASIDALEAGAYDYLPKPFSAMQLRILVGRAAKQARLARDNRRLREQLHRRSAGESIIGVSPALARVLEMARKVAATDASIFITGESGTGKDLLARAIHRQSRRSDREFVPMNCAAVPGTLLESELFGHEKGAFTGADSQRAGLIQHAAGGTFFLDEICEMPAELQAKMLRVLQERRVRPVGGEREVPVDVRWIAATNKEPEREVRQGRLRRDLYFRLNVVPLRMPPLRERREDIPVLANHFLARYSERYGWGSEPCTIGSEGLRALTLREWPGNVRELQNVIERAVSLAPAGRVLGPDDFEDEDRFDDPGTVAGAHLVERPFHEAKSATIESFERRYLAALLTRYGGNISRAARAARIARKTIHRLLAKYELTSRGDEEA